jgi:uncharacterized protein YdeI (YjbR/CyaY-like superfamily)
LVETGAASLNGEIIEMEPTLKAYYNKMYHIKSPGTWNTIKKKDSLCSPCVYDALLSLLTSVLAADTVFVLLMSLAGIHVTIHVLELLSPS